MVKPRFSPSQYKKILTAAKKSRYRVVTVKEFVRLKSGSKNPFIILRHDVDDNIRYAVEMAKIENSFGIKATYYIRKHPKVWVPSAIRAIESMGHEIGYHYECLSKSKGDIELALKIFSSELNELRSFVNSSVETCCMHGDPFSKFDNRMIWKYVSLSNFGLSAEAYLSLASKDIAYFSDSGYSWRKNYSVYDHFEGLDISISNTEELIKIIMHALVPHLYILFHPILWMGNIIHLYYQMARELLLRIPKRFIIKILKA